MHTTNNYLDCRIDDLDLSNRAHNNLKNNSILNVRDLIKYSEIELLRLPNMGLLSVNEIKKQIKKLDLFLKGTAGIPIDLTIDQQEALCIKISDLDLSARTLNVLKSIGKYIGDIIHIEERALLRFQNCGRRSVKEIKEYLQKNNLSLGTYVKNWPYNNIKEINEHLLLKTKDKKFNEINELNTEEILSKILFFLEQKNSKNSKVQLKDVIKRRYTHIGNLHNSSETLEDVAKDFGVTRERIRQLQIKAMNYLQNTEIKTILQIALDKNLFYIFDTLSKKTNFISQENLTVNLLKYSEQNQSKAQLNGFLDLCIDVCFDGLENYLHQNYKYLNHYKLWYRGSLNIDDIEEQIEEIDYLLDTLPMPQPISNIKKKLNINSELFEDAIDAIYISESVQFYNNYVFPYSHRQNKKIRKDYKIGTVISKYIINIHSYLQTKNKKYYLDSKFADEMKMLQDNGNSLIPGISIFQRGRAIEARRAFRRQNVNHLMFDLGYGFIRLGENNVNTKKFISNGNQSTNDGESDEQLNEIQDSVGKYGQYKQLLYEILDEYQLLSIKEICTLYAAKADSNFNENQAELIVRKILNQNDIFESLSSSMYGLSKNNNIEIFNSEVFQEKFIDKINTDERAYNNFEYEAKLYIFMRYADESFKFFKMHSYDFEKNLCKIFEKLDENKLDKIVYNSLLYISNPNSWNITEEERNHYEEKKRGSNFLLKLNLRSMPKISNDYKEYLINKKIENIVKIALFANINNHISGISANFANSISPLKAYFSIHHLALMSAVGLFDAPDNHMKSYKINGLNAEFCELLYDTLPFKKEITWSDDIGKWLINKFEANVDSFFAKDNWINS